MGKCFELIADNVLKAEDSSSYEECQCCGSENVAVYESQGYKIIDGQTDYKYDVSVACEVCLKAGLIEHIGEEAMDVLIDQFANNPEEQKALLRQTPRLPIFVQDEDWPLCCGILTKFVGEPTKLQAEELDHTGQYWYQGPSKFKYLAVNLVPSDILGVLGGISAFQCRICKKCYWIFQFT